MSRQEAWDIVEGRVTDVYDLIPEPDRRATFDDHEFSKWFWFAWVNASLLSSYRGSVGHLILQEKAREAARD